MEGVAERRGVERKKEREGGGMGVHARVEGSGTHEAKEKRDRRGRAKRGTDTRVREKMEKGVR